MADKKQPSNKMSKILDMLENIISLFEDKKDGLSTTEIYKGICDEFGYDKTLRNFELTYLPKLENGIIKNVTFKKVNNGKHTLVDNRIIHSERKVEKHKKMLSKEKLMAEEKAYMRLALQAIKDLPKLSDKHYAHIEQRFGLDNLNTPYFIESEETELLEPSNFNTSELIYAITNDCPVEFKYSGKSRKDLYLVEPYKIITFDGLWYLFGKDTDDSATPYKTWRLKYIDNTDIDRTEKHQTSDDLIEKVLDKAHSADFIVDDMQDASVRSIHVEVKVSAFIVDKIQLPGEIEERLNTDGSRTIICDISSIKEIDRDIKAWLPHIEIIAPLWYREKIREELAGYLKNLEG